ncbi:S-adenosyl-L-methionine-dependent methyltransferase [Massariosphaeria phaeospora]|uniref:tRNA (adenine(58)-N(1))-methyltransferase catalytic subunit TRM61 n=1 Tax=Massariosphaeria phaeospora TaxID=100035 RepID=A0A7C8ID70_9PLEO|nr:S-adenosyl-L-methionine-dependent methyltransferase [Massariosphaeria phaeospora]
MAPSPPTPSPFFDPGTHSAPNSLGIIQLRRDHLIPTVLSSTADADYKEGKVENTRFGSFPHSTLIKQPWGSQVLASVVDTGSRSSKSKKRKRGPTEEGRDAPVPESSEVRGDVVKAETASSGFAHLIPPSPETWTLCLPHRTQVVYTPDYSYILQRLRVRPGDHIIEAGAGSGSFTHAAVRAIFNGYPSGEYQPNDLNGTDYGIEPDSAERQKGFKQYGGVYSFEYHAPRAKQLETEIEEHGLSALVTVTNRDVYQDGFCLPSDGRNDQGPNANAIFLDLPAPWLALKHLARSPPSAAVLKSVTASSDPSTPDAEASVMPQLATEVFRSPLNPNKPVHICTFSPCIEQVTKTVSAMRSLGWLEIDMVEIMSKRLEVRRERIGLQEEGLRNANPNAATVVEAVQRLRDVEERAKVFHGLQKEKQEEVMRRAEAKKRGEQLLANTAEGEERTRAKFEGLPPSKLDRLERAKKDLQIRELFKEGRLVHRTEPELKTHTSYLVFATLPREWNEADEETARKRWG